MSLGFQADDGVQLIGWVLHECSLVAIEAGRNPIHPVQTHHVVDAQEAGMAHVMAKACDEVIVSALARMARMHGSETPVLPLAEESIRRCAAGNGLGEYPGVTVQIESLRMDSQGKIQIEARAALRRASRQCRDLSVCEPLDVTVIAARRIVEVERARTVRAALHACAKCGIGPKFWIGRRFGGELNAAVPEIGSATL